MEGFPHNEAFKSMHINPLQNKITITQLINQAACLFETQFI